LSRNIEERNGRAAQLLASALSPEVLATFASRGLACIPGAVPLV
jgi:hypothetical protein